MESLQMAEQLAIGTMESYFHFTKILLFILIAKFL
jgi:hypothetical protein